MTLPLGCPGGVICNPFPSPEHPRWVIHYMVTVLGWTFPEAAPRQGLGVLFHIQMSNFPARFVEKDDAFLYRIAFVLWLESIGHRCVGLFLDCLFCFIDLCLLFHHYHCLDYRGFIAGLGLR